MMIDFLVEALIIFGSDDFSEADEMQKADAVAACQPIAGVVPGDVAQKSGEKNERHGKIALGGESCRSHNHRSGRQRKSDGAEVSDYKDREIFVKEDIG